MGIKLNKKAYKELIKEDMEKVEKYFPEHSLEKKHIQEVLRSSIECYYPSESKKQTTDEATAILPDVRRMFLGWVNEFEPDVVSRSVLASLLAEYSNGNKEPLFKKFKHLTDREFYTLADIFKECFKYIGINDEYLKWLGQNYA